MQCSTQWCGQRGARYTRTRGTRSPVTRWARIPQRNSCCRLQAGVGTWRRLGRAGRGCLCPGWVLGADLMLRLPANEVQAPCLVCLLGDARPPTHTPPPPPTHTHTYVHARVRPPPMGWHATGIYCVSSPPLVPVGSMLTACPPTTYALEQADAEDGSNPSGSPGPKPSNSPGPKPSNSPGPKPSPSPGECGHMHIS